MSFEVCERELGTAALDFMMERLTKGSALAQLAAKRVPWTRGTVTTLLPPNVTSKEALDFRSGGKLPQRPASTWVIKDGMVLKPVPNTLRDLAGRLQTVLASNPSAIGLFENLMARPGDQYLARLRSRLIAHESEIYHLLTGDMGVEGILATLKEARSLPDLTGFIGLAPPELADRSRHPFAQLTSADIHLFSSTIGIVVVGAYDGESYLMWRRATNA